MTPSPAARACKRCNGLGVIFKQGGGCIHTGEFVDDEERPCPERCPAARAEALEPDETLTPEEAWDDLVNKVDRNSPEEYPEMALITFDELAGYMRQAAPALDAQARLIEDARNALIDAQVVLTNYVDRKHVNKGLSAIKRIDLVLATLPAKGGAT